MIKLEHNIFKNRGIVSFAVEASSIDELKVLDLLRDSLVGMPHIELGYVNSKRLVFHVSGLDKSVFEDPEPKKDEKDGISKV